MPMLVHLAPEKALPRIRRNGLRPGRPRANAPAGVFCMPVLRDYFASHQWLRELRRSGHRLLVAVHFRVRDDEPVLVGHFGQEKLRLGAGEAIGMLLRLSDPRGYELIVPRAIEPGEIHAVRAVRQVVGWRFHPGAKGTRPCGCEFCQRGGINARRLRTPEPPARPKRAILADLGCARSTALRVRLLDELGERTRGNAVELRPLMNEPPEVLCALASTLGRYRGPEAKKMLRELCAHPHAQVRVEAAAALARKLGRQARAFLGPLAEDPVVAETLAEPE